jgi:large subunit ribosomal protein L18
MTITTTYETPFRRRKEGKTDYQKRLALVRSRKIRIVVRKTNTRIIAQAMKFDPKGDTTVASADSIDLEKFGWYGTNNTPSAYLAGYLLGKKLGAEACVLDIGRKHPSHGSVIFAVAKGAFDAGTKVPFDPVAVPSEERLNGKMLDEYSKKLGDKAKVMFSKYIKAGMTPGEFNKAFEKAKTEIAKVKA